MPGIITTLLKYETKLYLRSGAMVALVIGLVMPLMLFLPANPAGRVQAAVSTIEVYVTIGAPLLLGGAIAREHEGATADILFARPVSRYAILATRIGLGVLALALLDLTAMAVFGLRGTRPPLTMAFSAAFPGALLLSCGALAVGTIARVAAAGYLAPLAFWLIDWGTRGAYTGKLTLFAYSFHDAWWGESKALLALAALVCCGVAALAVGRRR